MNTCAMRAPLPGRKLGVRWSRGTRLSLAGVLLILAAFIAGGKPFGVWQDAENYAVMFDHAANASWSELLTGSDPLYAIASRLAFGLGSGFELFALAVTTFACILKIAALRHVDIHRGVAVLVYLSYLFWLHDYTQIRLALALALTLYGIYGASRQRWFWFVIAAGVHLSVVAVAALYLAATHQRRGIVVAVVVLPLAGILVMNYLDALSLLVGRITLYSELYDAGGFTEINIFSLMPMNQAVLMAMCLPQLHRLPAQARTEFYLCVVGLVAFYSLSFLPVLAFRVNELFIPFLIVLVSRVWRLSSWVKLALLTYVLLGLRSSFVGPGSLLALFGV